jgi:hypothetical protein
MQMDKGFLSLFLATSIGVVGLTLNDILETAFLSVSIISIIINVIFKIKSNGSNKS